MKTSGDRGARATVWCVWVAMLVLLAWSMAPLLSRVPLAEDWYSVAPLTGHQSNLPAWLWEQNNEHRMPLARLLLLGALTLTHGDYRIGGIVNAALLAIAAAGLIVFARRARGGRADYADAFFPLLLLHFGQSNQVLFPWQLTFVLSIVFVLALGAALFTPAWLSSRGATAVAAITLPLLPLSGFIGLSFGGPVALYALMAGARRWRGRGYWLVASAVGAGALAALYFVGYEHPRWNPPSPGIVPSAKVMLKVLSLGFGPAAEFWWAPAVVGVVLLLVSSCWQALRHVTHTNADRLSAIGPPLFLATSILFAGAVGWGRAGYVPDFGIPIRYVLLVAPMFVACYLTWTVSRSRARLVVQRTLALVMLVLVPVNTVAGHRFFADWYHEGMARVETDLRGGMPIDDLAARHQEFLVHWWTPAELATRMGWLRDAGVEPFAVGER